MFGLSLRATQRRSEQYQRGYKPVTDKLPVSPFEMNIFLFAFFCDGHVLTLLRSLAFYSAALAFQRFLPPEQHTTELTTYKLPPEFFQLF
jgi:hypothetical protein